MLGLSQGRGWESRYAYGEGRGTVTQVTRIGLEHEIGFGFRLRIRKAFRYEFGARDLRSRSGLASGFVLELRRCFLLPTSYFLLPTSYCLLPTAHCPLPTAYCLLPTAHCLLPTAYLSYRGAAATDAKVSTGGEADGTATGA